MATDAPCRPLSGAYGSFAIRVSASRRGGNGLIILASLLVVAVGSVGSAQPILPTSFQPSTRLVRAEAWRDFTYWLLMPGDSSGKDAFTSVAAKVTYYRVPGASYSFRVVVMHDPRVNKTYVISSTGGNTGFYVSRDSGMLAVQVDSSGDLQWVGSFLEIPGRELDLAEAEKRFESEFNETKVSQHLARAASVGLTMAMGSEIFGPPGSHFQKARDPLTVHADINGRLLHIDVANSKIMKTASAWIDLGAARIVRAIDASGRERRNVRSTKLWRQDKVLLMRSGADGAGVATPAMEVPARTTDFTAIGTGENFPVAAIQDPKTKKITFISQDQFHIATNAGMISGYAHFGNLVFRGQLLETPGSAGIDVALEQFAASFNLTRYRRVVNDDVQIRLDYLFPRFFVRGAHSIDPSLEQVDISDGILHLVLVAPDSAQTAATWVDIRPGSLFLQRIVRAELAGRAVSIPPIWLKGKAKVATPGGPARREDLREVEATYARLPMTWSGLFVAAVHDVPNKNVSIVAHFNDFFPMSNAVPDNQAITFYVPRTDGLLGVSIYLGTVQFAPARFVTPDAGGSAAAVSAFDSAFDRDTFERQIAASKVVVDIANAVGVNVFLDPGVGRVHRPRVDVIDLQGSTLRLVLTNTASQRTVTLWFDVNSLRLTRWSVDAGPRVEPRQ